MEYKNVALRDLSNVAKEILSAYPSARIFVFEAEMGAGKTTLITEMCHLLGVGDEVASPTFAIVNVYLGKENRDIYHFDFYRLNKIEEAFEIGFYEYFDSGAYCFVEWPGLIKDYLPERYIEIKILRGDGDDKRNIAVSEVKNGTA